ncbi:MAG: hypothetical protein JWL69_1733 [Phycisphaerales bacterium]|nr:hypothetical protein [Phycisphaerales bacterium]
MFLPVLLVRDFGDMGWLVFAAPNVIGAAAMGWVLRRRETAQRLAETHRPAGTAFSFVTILFHAFFVGWIIRGLVGEAAGIFTAVATAGLFFLGRRGRRDLIVAAAVLAVSLVLFAFAAWGPGVPEAIPLPTARLPMTGLLWLAPVCVFGFALCPYLDLTFLRARASTTTNAAIAAFTLGFGIFFLLMIVFTLWYAPYLQPGYLAALPRPLAWIIAVHMMLQTAFTVAVHWRAIGSAAGRNRLMPWIIAVGAMIALFIGMTADRPRFAFINGELVYRLFMSFYGLVFPAYAWLCMIPAHGSNAAPSREKLLVLAVTVAVAAPMFWMGFIAGRMIWLVPGLTVVLLARLALPRDSARRKVDVTAGRPITHS